MTHFTEKLYDSNPYDVSFQAEVLEVVKDKDSTALILDRTLFFPEGGGQVPDKGTIQVDGKSYDVIDVQIVDGAIYHYIDAESFGLGNVDSKAKGDIDFQYRFSNMQQHSGEHIFSGLAHKYYDCTNVGFHLSDSEVTFDYDKPLSEEQIYDLETKVNEIIYQNRKITAFYPSEEELLNLDYRSKIEIEEDVRLVEIEGVDLCACCAPHVRYTGEIGICKVVDFINYKGGVRINILCGSRALEYYRKLDDITRGISRHLSAARAELVNEVDRISESLKEIEYKKANADKRYLDLIFELLVLADRDYEAAGSIEAQGEVKIIALNNSAVIISLREMDAKAVREMVNRLKSKFPDRLTGVITDSPKGYAFVMGSESYDCRKVADILRKQMSAKGGGSESMIQGNLDKELTDRDIDLLCTNAGEL